MPPERGRYECHVVRRQSARIGEDAKRQLLDRDQVRSDGELNQLGTRVQVETTHDALPVPRNGLVAESELFANLQIAATLGDELQDLTLAGTKHLEAPNLGALALCFLRLAGRVRCKALVVFQQ